MKTVAIISRTVTTALFCLLIAASASAQRQPVLRQIAVPHDYYFKEMYLPQVSSGPQSPDWPTQWLICVLLPTPRCN
jgi:TolB protein